MAYSKQTLASQKQTSVHGRRMGLDRLDFITGVAGVRMFSEDITTAGTTANIGGVSRITATGSSQGPVSNFLPAPIPGVVKVIQLVTTSTGSHQFNSTANGAAIVSASDGTTKATVNFIGPGGSVTLRAESTSRWEVIAQTGSVTFTTST